MRIRRLSTLLAGLATTVCLGVEKPKPPTPVPPTAAANLDPSRLKAFKARAIGPAVMGGRVSDIALDPENPYVFYIGFATGGVAKTSNNGGTFQGVFEKESVASIGAVAVAPSDAEDDLGRHGRGQRPQQLRPGETACTSRPTAATPGRTSA